MMSPEWVNLEASLVTLAAALVTLLAVLLPVFKTSGSRYLDFKKTCFSDRLLSGQTLFLKNLLVTQEVSFK
jgi:hypothetical protein